MEGRMTMSNMAIEAGAKAGLIAPDAITKKFAAGRAQRPPRYYVSDPGAVYERTEVFDVTRSEPVVANRIYLPTWPRSRNAGTLS